MKVSTTLTTTTVVMAAMGMAAQGAWASELKAGNFEITYRAEAGELNRVSVTQEPGVYRIRDDFGGNLLHSIKITGSRCDIVTATEATCDSGMSEP